MKLNVLDLVLSLETGKFGAEAESITEETVEELSNNKGDDDDE